MKPYLLLFMAMLTPVNVSFSDDAPKMSRDAEKTAEYIRKNIASELKGLPNHPWAGHYYAGDGLGVNVSLDLAPKSGFVFEWHGCLGLYDRNCGAVDWANSQLHLSFTFANQREGFQGIARDLIPVPWGNRRYLVPADDIVGFCNKVMQGNEPRHDMHGAYLLRSGDERKRVSGMPKVPPEFQSYLISKPIVAEVISVGTSKTRPSVADWKFKDTPVVLNAGTNQNLLPGMELLLVKPANRVESVRITKVTGDHSEAIMTQIGENEPGPNVGWCFSTRSPWNGL